MIPLSEPQRWIRLITSCQKLSQTFPWVSEATKIGSDIFLIIYPIFLTAFYLYGVAKKKEEAKVGALFIFLSCGISLLVNIGIQTIFIKSRPLVQLMNAEVHETFLHKFLPESSFPSDHAVVGMSIAIATLLWGIKSKNKKLIWFSIFLLICAVIMGVSRVFTIVHRPSDILWWFLVGIIVPVILYRNAIFAKMKRWLITPLIQFQEWLFWLFSK